MMSLGVRHLPVIHEGELVGVISARDLLLLEAWSPLTPDDWFRSGRRRDPAGGTGPVPGGPSAPPSCLALLVAWLYGVRYPGGGSRETRGAGRDDEDGRGGDRGHARSRWSPGASRSTASPRSRSSTPETAPSASSPRPTCCVKEEHLSRSPPAARGTRDAPKRAGDDGREVMSVARPRRSAPARRSRDAARLDARARVPFDAGRGPGRRVIGIVARRDLLKVFLRPDADIRDEIAGGDRPRPDVDRARHGSGPPWSRAS